MCVTGSVKPPVDYVHPYLPGPMGCDIPKGVGMALVVARCPFSQATNRLGRPLSRGMQRVGQTTWNRLRPPARS